MESLLSETSLHLSTIQSNAISNIRLFSNSRLLRQYILLEDEDERYDLLQIPLQRQIKSYQQAYPDYYEFRILLPNGYEDFRQSSQASKNIIEYERSSDLFKKISAHKESIYTEISINPDNNETTLFVSKKLVLNNPAIDAHNTPARLRGFLILSINMRSLQNNLIDHEKKHPETLIISDKNGLILLQSNNNIFNKQIRTQELNSLKSIVYYKPDPLIKLNSKNYFARGKRLDSGIYIFSLLPEHELQEQNNKLITSIIIIFLMAILFTVSIIYLAFKQYILRHISRISTYATEIGRGNLDIDINRISNDEIGELTKSINDMKASLKESNDQIKYIAYHDSLTGLPNRHMFKEYLAHTLSAIKRKNGSLALLFLDLDNFKYINDSLGHENGDILLQTISERLNTTLRDSDFLAHIDRADPENMVARLGGDEFIILLTNIENNFTPSAISKRIINEIAKPVSLQAHEVFVSVSIGITIFPDDSDDIDTLIKNADIAMYHAKEQGKNNFQYFSNNMNESMSIRLSLENRLRKAISNNEFELYYQPQVDCKTNKIIAAEALLRWNSSDMGMIFPDQFINIAEECGLILKIGEWALNQACLQLKDWQQQGLGEIAIAVNVSSIQFSRQKLIDLLGDLLKKHSLNPKLLEIELTESIFLEEEDKAAQTLSSIRHMGIKVSLDDFGTGYSSLAYLRKYPIDTLKIDRSFILEISNSTEGEAIITAIISMAHAMGLSVVAEGVEDETQLSFLRTHHCDYIQGYFFYKPMTATDLTKELKSIELDQTSI